MTWMTLSSLLPVSPSGNNDERGGRNNYKLRIKLRDYNRASVLEHPRIKN